MPLKNWNGTTEERFLKKVVKNFNDKGCWFWNASKERGGYGRFWDGNSYCKSHRYSYRFFVGEIPENLCVCHTCDNRWCVNPEHLWLGTYYDNAMDCVKKGRHTDARGFKNGRAKLTVKDIENINKSHFDGVSVAEIAKKFGVWNTTVYDIINKTTWKI